MTGKRLPRNDSRPAVESPKKEVRLQRIKEPDMRIRQQLALGVLLGMIAGALGFASLAYSQTPVQIDSQPPGPSAQREESLPQHLARNAKLSEVQANRFLQALGPTIREELSKGKEVVIPGLGTFRIVRVAEHR